jgi:hypothetical protein
VLLASASQTSFVAHHRDLDDRLVVAEEAVLLQHADAGAPRMLMMPSEATRRRRGC